jgi:thiol-disulfide isomerase/thioredoxin
MRALVAVFLLASSAATPAEEEISEGLPAPSFSLRTLNPDAAGASWIALDRLVGESSEDPAAKAVLVSFFASWCEPCKREMPFLVQLDRTYRGQGLRILAVSIDREEAGIEAARKLAAANEVTYPVLSDRFNFLARRYLGEQAPLPSVFLVRKEGTLAKIERGYSKDASAFLVAEVEAVLGIRRSAAGAPARAGGAPPAKAAAATGR